MVFRQSSAKSVSRLVRRAALEVLETRQLLAANIAHATPTDCSDWVTPGANTFFPAYNSTSAAASSGPQFFSPGQANGSGYWGGGIYGAMAASYTTRAGDNLPLMSSLPGAPVSIYLDFDGFVGNGYGGAHNDSAYDTDGNVAAFSVSEQQDIVEGWRRIAAYFSNFNINVTTIAATGTNVSWSLISNSISGGYSYGAVGTSNGPASFNAAGDLIGRTSGIIHEIGHNFGLGHQSTYDDLGVKIREYRYRIDDLHGVIMGVDFDGFPIKWINGHPSGSNTNVQNDLAVIAAKVVSFGGGDGYRADEYGDTIATATALTLNTNAYGIIERKSDGDMFSFTSTGATYAVTVTPDSPSALDTKLEIYDGTGTLLAMSDPTAAITGSVTMTLAAGTYYARVASHNNYDDVGTYAIKFNTATAGTTPTYNGLLAPTNVVAALGTGANVNLSWTLSTSSGITGYTIESSIDNLAWVTETTVGAAVTTYTDTGLQGSRRYFYRISTNNASGKSVPSTVATIINRPSAVTGLRVASISSTRLVLDWVETTGETGYRIERSPDGTTWTQIGTATEDNVSYADNTVTAGNVYYYRVTPTSALGDGVAVVDSGTTPLAAVSGFTLTNIASTSIQLNWTDLSNEDSYLIEISTDGTNYSTLATPAAGTTTYIATGLTPTTEYYFRLAGKLNGVVGTKTTKFAPTPTATPLPTGWASANLGTTTVNGVGEYRNGILTSIGATGDIWNTSDSGRYTYTTLNGDGEMVARITAVENNATWVKYGVMMRETTAANSKQAIMLISSASGAAFQYRTTAGGSSSNVGATATAPYWVKMTRVGTTFTGSISPDGVTWTVVGTATISMATSIKMGLALATNVTTTLTTATADKISAISGGVALNMPPVGVPDSATTTNLTPVTVNVLANDTDPEGNSLTLTGITQPAWGTVVINGDNTLTYTATDKIAHTDTFTYTVNDTAGNSDIVTVTINKKGTLHRWEFNEGAGSTLTDITGNDADGTITNASWATGRSGKTLVQNGTSTGAQVSFGTGASLSGTTDFSLGVWVKTTATTTGYLISQRDSDIAGEYVLNMTSAGKVSFMIYNGSYQFNITSSNAINDGTWHYIQAQRSGLVGTIYIDGVSRATATGTSTLALGGTIDTFSGWDGRDLGSYFNGQMDDLTVYNYALSVGEITTIRDTTALVTPATAATTTVTGNSVALNTLGVDYNGESTLKYTWSVLGTPPAPVSFTMNGANGGKNTTALFIKAGTYNFSVDITDGTTTLTSTVSVVVNSTLTSLAVSPASPNLQPGQTQQFTATAYDQFGEVMATPFILWSLGVGSTGSINGTGLYTAGQGAGTTVIATSGSVSGSTPVIVGSSAPTIATAAHASSTLIVGKTVDLGALGADDGGEANLNYTWSVASGPGPVAFSSNGSNAGKDTTASFSSAGNYTLKVTIADAGGASVSSTVAVTVLQTAQLLKVAPTNVLLGTNQTRQFVATATDQFGQSILSPSVTWSITSGAGSIAANGLFTAPAAAGKTIVRATFGALTVNSTATIFSWSPYNLTGKKTGSNVSISWRDSTAIETGFQIQVGQRQSNGTILWTTYYTTGASAGSGGTVNYAFASAFTAGTWAFRVRANSASGVSNWSNTALVTV